MSVRVYGTHRQTRTATAATANCSVRPTKRVDGALLSTVGCVSGSGAVAGAGVDEATHTPLLLQKPPTSSTLHVLFTLKHGLSFITSITCAPRLHLTDNRQFSSHSIPGIGTVALSHFMTIISSSFFSGQLQIAVALLAYLKHLLSSQPATTSLHLWPVQHAESPVGAAAEVEVEVEVAAVVDVAVAVEVEVDEAVAVEVEVAVVVARTLR
eukprot:TRINITY_DN1231_c0_g1_i1.p1 TRINITY_DN1231_c0_g1~~TRINITY_DN1231_c0_g1_i1.p1  ORF type:complete len:211 (+),score=1.63 TRINITY_DN1231_c0_g1_i1:123-755(+)